MPFILIKGVLILALYEDVQAFIDENIYQSKVWDSATESARKKAVNNSARILKSFLPSIYVTDVPVEHLAEQTVWLMKIDDSFQRSELGATSMSVDGFSISIADKDRSISPFILRINGISPDSITGGLTTRKVGRYSCETNAKRWIY